MMRWTSALWLLLLVLTVAAAHAQQQVRFHVLGLFHPQEILLDQEASQVVSVTAGGARFVLNGEPGHRRLRFHVEGNRVLLEEQSAEVWTATARNGEPVAFQLTVPGKLTRSYEGRLTVTAHQGELLAVVAMNRETAVASIVASELDQQAPMEAQKAQAVAARSFILAGGRHQDYDFCDTTHCQFLRSPPASGSQVWRAVNTTRGMVLSYRGKPLAAMYSSRCGGHTHSLQDVGRNAGQAYPYYAVRCGYCSRHPLKWQSWIGENGQAPEPGNESRRIAVTRQWGWSAIPGSDFTATREGAGWRLEGHGVGHGVGMCQYGAAGMAAAGAGFREILAHYYPNTEVVTRP